VAVSRAQLEKAVNSDPEVAWAMVEFLAARLHD
jgi:hypothetical protein